VTYLRGLALDDVVGVAETRIV